MADVKSRLKLFEADSEKGNMASARPQVALKPTFSKNVSPALQKFMEKQNAALEGKEETKSFEKPAPSVSGAKMSPVELSKKPSGSIKEGNENKKPIAIASASNNVSERSKTSAPRAAESRRVSVPKVFQEEEKSSNAPKPPAKPSTNSSVVKPSSTLPPTTRPKPAGETKPIGINQNSPVSPISNNPQSAIKPGTNSTAFSAGKVKLPQMDKQPVSGSDSTTSTSSSHSSSSASSQPPQSPSNEPGVIDFRKHLRSTRNSIGNNVTPLKAVLPVATQNGSNGPNNKHSVTSPSASSKTTPQIPVVPKAKGPSQELKRQSSNVILERKSDSKKFKKVKLQALPPAGAAPAKPALPKDLDLSLIRQQYHKTVATLEAEANAGEEDDDDIYTDASSEVLPRRSAIRTTSARISFIPDMSAEEEGVLDDAPIYDDGCTPVSPPPVPVAGDEVYVDAETERKGEEDEDDNIYEPEDSLVLPPRESEEDKKKRLREEAEAKKKEEKERREREKEEEKKRKKEEKERAKKEKEEMKLKKQFNLTGDETDVGEGVIKQDMKGWGSGGLSVKKGQMVTIIRLDNNPPNKWLIRSEGGIGYVDSSIIEVEPAIIRQIMLRSFIDSTCNLEKSLAALADRKAMNKERKPSSTSRNEDQPTYDPVANEAVPEVNDMEDDEDIYEPIPD